MHIVASLLNWADRHISGQKLAETGFLHMLMFAPDAPVGTNKSIPKSDRERELLLTPDKS